MKKRFNVIRIPRPKPVQSHEVWSIDFVHDRFENGPARPLTTKLQKNLVTNKELCKLN